MSWQDEPATSAQLCTIREFYAREIGWNRAQSLVAEMKQAKFTKGMASKELKRLYNCKAHGWATTPEE
jgi:hypothetical protein